MSRSASATPLQAATRLGAVHLRVMDLERLVLFYRQALGLKVHRQDSVQAALGADGEDLLVLTRDPQAHKERRTAGLYHFCLAVSERKQLGWWLQGLLERETPLQGLVDHRMAEAVYLQDPEGNGIELNWDRPRDQWPDPQRLLSLGNGPLDTQGLLDANAASPTFEIPTDTRVGHIHLHVGDLEANETFYCGLIGLDKVMEFPGQAVFTSAGGYHHHVAFNLWNGRDARPADAHASGLDFYSFHVSPSDREAIRERLAGAAWDFSDDAGILRTRDASGNALHFVS